MAEQLAENYHNTWGRKKKLELQAKGEKKKSAAILYFNIEDGAFPNFSLVVGWFV